MAVHQEASRPEPTLSPKEVGTGANALIDTIAGALKKDPDVLVQLASNYFSHGLPSQSGISSQQDGDTFSFLHNASVQTLVFAEAQHINRYLTSLTITKEGKAQIYLSSMIDKDEVAGTEEIAEGKIIVSAGKREFEDSEEAFNRAKALLAPFLG